MQIVTEAESTPVSVEDVKAYLRIDADDEDETILPILIEAATKNAEHYTGRAFVEQVWQEVLLEWPSVDYIPIPRVPLISIDEFEYTEAGEEAVDVTGYTADLINGRAVLDYEETWPFCTLDPVAGIHLEWTCGYGEAEDVPEDIKVAIMLLVGHWFENREPVLVGTISSTLPLTVKALLNPYRTWEFT